MKTIEKACNVLLKKKLKKKSKTQMLDVATVSKWILKLNHKMDLFQIEMISRNRVCMQRRGLRWQWRSKS